MENKEYFTRSKMLSYKAAGVLPLCFYNGQAYVLLGAEYVMRPAAAPSSAKRQFLWGDFGGKREAVDSDPAATASREFSEETFGLFGGSGVNDACVAASAAAFACVLRDSPRSHCAVHRLRKGSYHMYVTSTPFIDPLMFQLARESNDLRAAKGHGLQGAEKAEFVWVLLRDLLRAVQRPASTYHLPCAHTREGRITARQRWVTGTMHLHPCFATTVRMAVGNGLLTFVARLQAGSVGQDLAAMVQPAATPSHLPTQALPFSAPATWGLVAENTHRAGAPPSPILPPPPPSQPHTAPALGVECCPQHACPPSATAASDDSTCNSMHARSSVAEGARDCSGSGSGSGSSGRSCALPPGPCATPGQEAVSWAAGTRVLTADVSACESEGLAQGLSCTPDDQAVDGAGVDASCCMAPKLLPRLAAMQVGVCMEGLDATFKVCVVGVGAEVQPGGAVLSAEDTVPSLGGRERARRRGGKRHTARRAAAAQAAGQEGLRALADAPLYTACTKRQRRLEPQPQHMVYWLQHLQQQHAL